MKAPAHPSILSAFKVNPDRALRDIAGEFAAGGERPFDDLSQIEDEKLWPEVHLIASLKSKETLFEQLPDELFIKSPNGLLLKRYPNAKRYLHLDLAESGTAGVSLCHKELGPDGKIIVVFDFYGKITSPDRISLPKIERFMVDLVRIGNIPIEIISADQYQSTHMRQRLEHEHNISAQVIKTPMGGETNIEPFNLIGTMMANGAVKVGPTTELKNQLESIYIYEDKIQYETDRKDIVDTVIGSCFIAINNTKDVPYHSYDAYELLISRKLSLNSLQGFSKV